MKNFRWVTGKYEYVLSKFEFFSRYDYECGIQGVKNWWYEFEIRGYIFKGTSMRGFQNEGTSTSKTRNAQHWFGGHNNSIPYRMLRTMPSGCCSGAIHVTTPFPASTRSTGTPKSANGGATVESCVPSAQLVWWVRNGQNRVKKREYGRSKIRDGKNTVMGIQNRKIKLWTHQRWLRITVLKNSLWWRYVLWSKSAEINLFKRNIPKN